MADKDSYAEAVARYLSSRKLHQGAKPGSRCRCGACRHQILYTAWRAGVAPQRLIDALPAEREPELRRAPKLMARRASVAEMVTVSQGGQREVGVTALLTLVAAR